MVKGMKKQRHPAPGTAAVLRTLRSNLRRFLSIFMIVALGSGFMAGLQAASPDMYETADRYFDDADWYDLDLKSPLGFTPADVELIRRQETVLKAEGAIVRDLVLTDAEGNEHTARVFALLDGEGRAEMNRPTLVSGRFPRNAGECIIKSALSGYDEHPPKVGDVLSLGEDAGAVYENVIVVGTAESPMCISLVPESTTAGTGSIALDVFVRKDFFVSDRFTDVYVSVRGAKELNTFSDAYSALIYDAAQTAGGWKSASEAALEAAGEHGIGSNEAALAALGEADPALSALLRSVSAAPAGEDRGGGPIVLTRDDSAGYDSYKSNVGKVAALAGVFPVFFFLVALLVALTAMTRLIDEKRTEIGVKKALGVSDGQILGEYLFYALIVSVPGCLFGLTVGFRLFPPVISGAYGMMFFLPPTLTPFRPDIAAWVAPVTVGSIAAAALFACGKEAASLPAPLLRPKAPAPGKRILLERIPFLWRPLPFLHKVTARNLFRYRKRFFMTVFGIMGCTALLLTGFGLRDSVNDIIAVQFGQIDHYHVTVVTDSASAASQDRALSAVLNDRDRIADHAAFSVTSGTAVNGRNKASVTMTVPEDTADLGRFITLRERKSRRALTLPEGGDGPCPVVMTEKLSVSLGLGTGDVFLIEGPSGRTAEAVLDGICENYLESGVYMTRESFLAAFGEVPDFRVLYCIAQEGAGSDSLTRAFLECPHVLYASSVLLLKENFSQALRGMDGVVIVLILAAGLLCVVVLYNLISINICERRKELATLSVLGCRDEETRRYIFRETDILSLIGALAGILPGRWLHSFVVRTVEIDQIMFGRTIHPESFLLSLAATLFFTLLCSVMMRRQIREIDMVEAMKAGE